MVEGTKWPYAEAGDLQLPGGSAHSLLADRLRNSPRQVLHVEILNALILEGAVLEYPRAHKDHGSVR